MLAVTLATATRAQEAAQGTTWEAIVDAATVTTGVLGVVVAALVAFMPYARRPRLSLIEDADKVHSHVESTPLGPMPYLRVLACNARRRRAALGTRVLIEGYRPLEMTAQPLTTLGHPSLGWPSAPEADETAAVMIFPGGFRPVGLGRLIRVRLDETGKLMRPNVQLPDGRVVPGPPHYGNVAAGDPVCDGWYLWLDIAFAQDISDDRDKLPPRDGGYLIRLTVGAEDGAARTRDVHINWNSDPAQSADDVLASALEHLAVVDP